MMPSKGQICKEGVWDESVPGISFNDAGVCNYAEIFHKMLADFPKGEKGALQWADYINKIKTDGKGKRYDCVIGLSGGTDSCYLLHLAKKNGLRPLAVNLDNGWSSDIAVKNMKKMTSALNIDLETHVIDYEEVMDVLKAYLKAQLPWADAPTDLAIKAVLFNKARKEGVKYILIGHDFRTEGFQPTEWTYSDDKQMRFLAKKFSGRKLKTFPNLSIWSFGYMSFLKGIKYVKPFFYLDYSKKDAKKLLTQEYGWEDYGGHHYENLFTKFIISYWLFEKFGIDKRKITFSAQVLSGEMTREEALSELARVPYKIETLESDISYLSKKLGITTQEFQKLYEGENKFYYDYPSYYPLYQRFRKIIFVAMKLFLPNKPLMFYQFEAREKKLQK